MDHGDLLGQPLPLGDHGALVADEGGFVDVEGEGCEVEILVGAEEGEVADGGVGVSGDAGGCGDGCEWR